MRWEIGQYKTQQYRCQKYKWGPYVKYMSTYNSKTLSEALDTTANPQNKW